MACCKVEVLVGIFVGLIKVVALGAVVCNTDEGSEGPEVDGLVGLIDSVFEPCVIESDP